MKGSPKNVEDWLAPFIIGRASLAAITAEDLDAALAALLPYELTRRLDHEAPAFFETPAGSRHALDYAAANGPLLSVRVQELFGLVGASDARRRPRSPDAGAFVAGASAHPDDARSAGLLGRLLGRGEARDEGPLSAPSLAGRSGRRRADDAGEAARNVRRARPSPAWAEGRAHSYRQSMVSATKCVSPWPLATISSADFLPPSFSAFTFFTASAGSATGS